MSRSDCVRVADTELLGMVTHAPGALMSLWLRDPGALVVWYGRQGATVDQQHVRAILLRHPRVVMQLRARAMRGRVGAAQC